LTLTKSLKPVLDYIGVRVGFTAKGGLNIDQVLLESAKHPVADSILRAKKLLKLQRDFVCGIQKHTVNGRIHCTFNQLKREQDGGGDDTSGAAYGRLSSQNPNLQQQPARDDYAAEWRAIYVPDTDIWASLDYSQQEPRWLTHYAELTGCSGATIAADEYRNNPKADNHTMMAELTGLPRGQAKQIFLGKCYGMGGAKFAKTLGLPTSTKMMNDGRLIEIAGPEAQKILDQFDAKAPYVKQLATRAEARAKEKGFVVTVLGRKCRFPKDENGRVEWANKALNRIIQGSAADQTKQALVNAHAEGIRVQLQIHDELGLSVESLADAERLSQIMVECVPMRLPSKVVTKSGKSWGYAK
jgi:DNA polymerase I-like protein with 3'-5' exonuclease and polymerase domains